MIKKVLFIQPFQFVEKNLSNEILMWFVYLDNFLKAKIKKIITDLIYLPGVNLNFNFNDSINKEELNNIYKILDDQISSLDFPLDKNTYICISIPTSFDYQAAKIIAEYLQKNFQETIIIIGGYHATCCESDFSYKNSPIDYTITSEGEISLFNLINSNAKKQDIPIIIKGTPIEDLDKLPPLDLRILDNYINSLAHNARGLAISLSRGCPYQCSYCCEDIISKGRKMMRWRVYSPQRAVQETQTLVNYGLNRNIEIYGFYDACFGFKKEWLLEFLEKYEVDPQVKYHFNETRIDILNEKLIKKLQEKKMFQFYGVESFSKEMLQIMNKCSNPEHYLNKFNQILSVHKKLEYKSSCGLLINHPGETKKTVNKTFSYLKKIIYNDENNIFEFLPTLYHLFGKTANYEGLQNLTKKYGTIAYFPFWWKDMRTLKEGAFAVRASSSLSLRECINLFVNNFLELERIIYKKNKKKGLGEFLVKRRILYKQRDELIKFLDDNYIELQQQKKLPSLMIKQK